MDLRMQIGEEKEEKFRQYRPKIPELILQNITDN